MAKLSLSRIFDSGRVIQSLSKLGAGDLEDFILYLADFASQTVGAFRKTLTVEDNLDSDVRTVDLKHSQILSINLQTKKVPKHVWITKVVPMSAAPLSFAWQMGTDATLQVKAVFTGTPTDPIATTLIILF